MALSAFDDKEQQPTPGDLEQVLGRAFTHWNHLIARMAGDYPPLEQVWGFPGAKYGWSLRLKQKKRTILYMTPGKGYALIGFVLGERAVRAAHESTLSAPVLAAIDAAPKYAEGRGFRLEVKSKKARDDVVKLAAIKMAH